MEKIAGHTFLAKLGKKKLRPGGKFATDWLLKKAEITAEKKVLEVACNMGTTLLELASKYHCQIIGVDLDKKAVEQAKINVAKANLEEFITVQEGDARHLPFKDETFDVVINEAMLTMHNNQTKQQCLKEYYRVLKPGGMLLTHDIELLGDESVNIELSKAINAHVNPLVKEEWLAQFTKAGFSDVKYINNKITLMSPEGMLYDEGILGMLKIFKNGLKRENREQFKKMFSMFRKNHENLAYIAISSKK